MAPAKTATQRERVARTALVDAVVQFGGLARDGAEARRDWNRVQRAIAAYTKAVRRAIREDRTL